MTRPDIAVRTVCLDCDDAHAMAGFYGGLLGWEPTFTEPDWVLMRNPDGGIGLSFQAEPSYRSPTWPEEGDLQQKMIHLDVRVTPSPGQSPEEASPPRSTWLWRPAAGRPTTNPATTSGSCSTRPGTRSACSWIDAR